MENFLLKFEQTIPMLENEKRWNTIINIVWKQWKKSPNDLNCLLCAGTQLWYTHVVMEAARDGYGAIQAEEYIDELELENKLIFITEYGCKHFENNAVFNAYFGYMISVFPYLFFTHGKNYDEVWTKGVQMMKKSYELDPDNPFCEAMYYEKGECGEGTLFDTACKKIWSKISPVQWGESEVQQYFFRILRGDIWAANVSSE